MRATGSRFNRVAILDLARPILPSLEGVISVVEGTYQIRADYLGVIPELPREAARRAHQLDAALLLRHFSRVVRLPDGSIGLLLTDQDLFVSVYNYIFGLAEPDLRWAIVSTHRLRSASQDLYLERVKKEVVHEVGHMAGLAHCENRVCAMSFSNSLAEVDRKRPALCSKCQLALASRFR